MKMTAGEPDTPVRLDLTTTRIPFPLPSVPMVAHMPRSPAAGFP
jgi:hypothetical protein